MSSFVNHGLFCLDRFNIYTTSKGKVYITDSDGSKLSCEDLETNEKKFINLQDINIKKIYYKNQGYLYILNPIKKYRTSDNKEVVVKKYEKNVLVCIDINSEEDIKISVKDLILEKDEIKEIKPFIIYEGVKIILRTSQKLKSTGESVEILKYDNEKEKALCEKEDGNTEFYNPFEEFEGFQEFADKYVGNKKNKVFYPKVYFENDDNSEKIPALISDGLESTKALINGSQEPGTIVGNNQDFTQLNFRCDNGDNVFVNLEDLENCEDIKRNAIEFYERKKSSSTKNYKPQKSTSNCMDKDLTSTSSSSADSNLMDCNSLPRSNSNQMDYDFNTPSNSNQMDFNSPSRSNSNQMDFSSPSRSNSNQMDFNSPSRSNFNQMDFNSMDNYNLDLAKIDRDILKKRTEISDLIVKRMEIPFSRNTNLEIAEINRDISYLNYQIYELELDRIKIIN